MIYLLLSGSLQNTRGMNNGSALNICAANFFCGNFGKHQSQDCTIHILLAISFQMPKYFMSDEKHKFKGKVYQILIFTSGSRNITLVFTVGTFKVNYNFFISAVL